jgi:hypothetical protein
VGTILTALIWSRSQTVPPVLLVFTALEGPHPSVGLVKVATTVLEKPPRRLLMPVLPERIRSLRTSPTRLSALIAPLAPTVLVG